MEIIDIMADVTARMIEGELLECSVSGDPDLDEDTYFKILELKTAALFSAACRIGGILGGAGKADVDRLGAFGTNIGLAFQIADDLLDFTGDASSLGKPVLSDLREGRTTLPIILALRTLQGQARDDFRRLILDRPSDPASLGRIRDITAAQGALEEAARTGARYSAAAKAYLDGYAPSIEVETLRRIGDFVLERTR
jgi:octaprenyl-diphosphate synthase